MKPTNQECLKAAQKIVEALSESDEWIDALNELTPTEEPGDLERTERRLRAAVIRVLQGKA